MKPEQPTKTTNKTRKLVINKQSIRELTPSELAENNGAALRTVQGSVCVCNC